MPAVTLIGAAPAFVSEEEYKSLIESTPASFSDLLPVLKLCEENVSVVLDPPVEGFSEQDAANGALLVLTSVLAFVSTTGKAFQVEYPSITLHAISRSGPKPSIYCQLDEEAQGASEDVEQPTDTDMRELYLAPASPDSLEPIFLALSHCASLHPDKFDDEDEDEGMDGAMIDTSNSPFEVFTGDGDQELSEVGKAALLHLESIIDDPFHPSSEDPTADPDEDEKKVSAKTSP